MSRAGPLFIESNFVSTLLLNYRELETNLNSFHILKYRMVDGFFVSAKNSGTHWLRHMLSLALAHHLELPPPLYASGPESDAFIGHPKHPRRYAAAPRLASSHNVPSAAIAWLGARRLLALPPTVVLVRDIRQAMLSVYVKWAGEIGTDLTAYVRRPAPGRVADVHWFARFFNHWGDMADAFGRQVLVVRYEDVQAAPEYWLRRIGTHYGIAFDDADVAAAMTVHGREAVRRKLDPLHGEAVVSDDASRAAAALSFDDERYLAALLSARLRHDFGYGYLRPASRPDPVFAPRAEVA